jgi:Leucine-rich repeat (LRR) protein
MIFTDFIISELTELRVLSVAGNQILELQSPLFADGSNLRSVSFSNNKIFQFAPSLFSVRLIYIPVFLLE